MSTTLNRVASAPHVKIWAGGERERLDSKRIKNEISAHSDLKPADLEFLQRPYRWTEKGAAFVTRYLKENPNDTVIVDSESFSREARKLKAPYTDRVHVLAYTPHLMPFNDWVQIGATELEQKRPSIYSKIS